MPEIPTSKLPSVAPGGPAAPYVSVNVNENQFGAGASEARARTGSAISHVGEVAAEHVVRFQQIQNQTEVDDVYSNKFSPAFREKYQQYYALQGKEALDRLPEFMKSMEEVEKETAAGLKNDAQRHMFRQTARRRVHMEIDSMVRYADQQNKVWQAQTSDAFLRNQLDQAADFHNDDQKFGAALGTGIAEIDRFGAQTGQSGEVMRDRTSRFISDAWTARIQRQLLQDPAAADAMYRANQQAVDARMRPQLEHQILSSLKPVQARQAADAIVEKNPAKSVDVRAMLGPWTKAAEERAEELRPGDAVFRDMMVSRVTHYVNVWATAQAGQERADRNYLLGLANGTPGQPTSKPVTMDALLSNDQAKAAWSRLDSFSQQALIARVELNGKAKDVPFSQESFDTYYRLKGLATSDPDAFVNTNLSGYATQIPHALLHELVQQQTIAARKDVRNQEAQINVNHALTIAAPALRAVGIDPKAKANTTKAAIYDQFVGRYTQQIDQFITNNKRRPNDKELQEITNSLLTAGAESQSGIFFDTKGRAFQIPPEKFYVPVPKAEKEKIIKEFKELRGHPPTEAQVTQIYTVHSLKKGQK